MAFDEGLAARVRQLLSQEAGVAGEPLFGGFGFLLHGNLLVGVWRDSLIVRVGPDAYEDALRQPHVREFDITGRPMKGWVLVDPGGVGHLDDLQRWIQTAKAFVMTLPPKR